MSEIRGQFDPMQYNEIKKNFQLATTECDIMINQINQDQNLNTNDARLVFFRKIAQINDMSRLSFDFYSEVLQSDGWWEKRFPNHIISKKNKQNLAKSYDQHVRSTFAIDNFSAFESSVRLVVQTFNPDKYKKLRYNFDKLIKWFLDETGFTEQYEIVKVFSNIRNSLHSNGLFNPFDQKNERITYQQNTFLFEVGKPISYGGWTDLFSITKIQISVFYGIVQHPEIQKIKLIKEPFSDFW